MTNSKIVLWNPALILWKSKTCQWCLHPPYSLIDCSIPEHTFPLNEIAISYNKKNASAVFGLVLRHEFGCRKISNNLMIIIRNESIVKQLR